MDKTIAANLEGLSVEEQRALLQKLLQEKKAKKQDVTAVLSFGQERLWFLHQFDSANAAYHLRTAVRLRGNLNLSALEASIQEVVNRHESLRTKIVTHNGRPQQQIQQQLTVPVPVTDLTNLPGNEQETAVQQQTDAEAQAPFDLADGPLFRARLLKLQADEHILLLTMHHIISDGWSIGILIREIATLYQAKAANQPSPLAEIPVQYSDFATWQREWLQGETLEKQLAYWREQLADTAVVDLPTDYPRPASQTFSGARHYFTISPDITNRFRLLTHAENATLFMSLMAAFNILLYVYSRQTDISVGTPVAGRNRQQLESVIGLFINTLVMRNQIDPQASFRDLLKQVRQTALEAFAHQDVPFEKLVQELNPPRDPSCAPYFQHLFIMQNAPMQAVELPGLSLTSLQPDKASSLFDLTLNMWDDDEGLRGYLEYNTDLFTDEAMARFVRHFQKLLGQIGQHPDQPIAQLTVLTQSERTQILNEWNKTAIPLPQHTLTQLFTRQVEHTPEAVAVTAVDGQLTYAQLAEKSNQLATYLRRFDIQPDTLIGLALPRETPLLIAILGVLQAGAAYLPLDPAYPARRIQYMLDHAQAPLLITTSDLLESLPPHEAEVLLIDEQWPQIAEVEPITQDFSRLDDLAYVIYTSGSTGQPKGVQITQRNLANFLNTMLERPGISSDDTLLAVTTLSFDIATLELYLPLVSGARVLLADQATAQDASLLLEQLAAEPVTLMQATPATWQMLLAAGWEGKSGLTILSGGEALPVSLARQLLARGTAVWNMYGPTETTVWSTCLQVTEAECQTDGVVSIGTPIGNTDVYVLDEQLNPVPVGVTANLYIAGAGVARGYLHQPDLTAERFPQHPFKPEERIYFTGDLARYRRDGRIEFLGRSDHQVKVRGFRIELGEIENSLQQHPAIAQAVVHPQGDQLFAYLITKGEDQPETAVLRTHLQERLPAYMIPHRFLFLDAYPLTDNGKVDRKALPSPDGDAIEAATQANYIAPRNALETQLAAIWQELLRVPQVGVHDNFFELGGHSLLATQLISQIQNQFNVKLPLRAIFEQTTVAQMAQGIADTQTKSVIPKIPAADLSQPIPVSFAQQRLLIIDQLAPNQATYNMPLAVRLDGRLDEDALQTTVNTLFVRHSSLRTTFYYDDARQPYQQIIDAVQLPINRVDLSDLPEAGREKEAQDWAQAETERPFSLTNDTLIRVSLIRLTDQQHVLVVVMHHIITDRWSMDIFIQELLHLYTSLVHQTPDSLPEMSIQYADFAIWQRDRLQGDVLDQQLAYWETNLADAPKVITLPTDLPRPKMQSMRGATYTKLLPPDLTQPLARLSQRHKSSLFMTLLAAYNVLLARYSQQDDIVVGSPLANRDHSDLQRLIGFFVNMLPLRTQIGEADTFLTLLAQVRQTVLDAYSHQDMPFEQMVDALQPIRDTSHSPIFQVAFAIQNAAPPLDQPDGLSLTLLTRENKTAKYDLTLLVTETDDGLSCTWEYSTDLFAPETIARLHSHFDTLLHAIIREPQRPVAKLPLLSTVEQQQILHEWQGQSDDTVPQVCLHEQFEAWAAKQPQATAVSDQHTTLSYTELNGRANQLARLLIEQGVQPGQPVGIHMPSSVPAIIAILACHKARAAYVPFDPAYPDQRLQFMLDDTAAPVLLTDAPLEQLNTDNCTVLEWQAIQPQLAQLADSNLDLAYTPTDPAYIIYTSGSTGKPKGVVCGHTGVFNLLSSFDRWGELPPQAANSLWTSLNFDVSVYEIFAPLVSGGSLHIVPADIRAEAQQLFTWLAKQQIASVYLPPFMLDPFAAWLREGQPTPPLQRMLVGVEPITEATLVEIQQRIPGLKLINGYGPTEATVCATLYPIPSDSTRPGITPMGRPVLNSRAYLLDKQMQPVPVGVPGELHIGGLGLAHGYLNRPQLTAEKFIADPFADDPEARLYRTGDLVRYLPDGNLLFVGRSDFQLKVRGFRVELGEIESHLLAQPGVAAAVIMPHTAVDGHITLVAYFVTEKDAPLDQQTLRDALNQKLPNYMIPALWIQLDEMPRTPNDKIDRKALPVPNLEELERTIPFTAPRTPLEIEVQTIWQSLLNVTDISVHDNFFALGGHSLLATQLVSRIQQHFNTKLPLREIFEQSTVAQMAQLIAGAQTQPDIPPILPVAADQEIPLSFAQQRLWVLEQIEPDLTAYNIPMVARLEGDLDTDTLQEAFNQLLARHDALRTTFTTNQEGEPIQQVHDDVKLEIPITTVVEVDVPDKLKEIVQRPFDLTIPPLLRVELLRVRPNDHLLVIVIHHIISDGWSVDILRRDIAGLYHALQTGQPSPLPTLPIQYTDFAAWQRNWLQGEVLEQQLSYWQQRLAGAPATLDLPTDFTRPTMQSYRGALYRHDLPLDLTQQVNHFSQQANATPFMTLLATYQLLLARYSGQNDIVVGSPIANRNSNEVENLIGFFVNMLVLRTQISTEDTFHEVLAQVRQNALDAYAHQDVPFEKLVDVLNVSRDMSYSPVFRVAFILQNTPKSEVNLGDVKMSVISAEGTTSKYDLTLTILDTKMGYRLLWEYCTDLFHEKTIVRLAAHFVHLLENVLAAPDLPVAELSILPQPEQTQILNEWNETTRPYPTHTLPQLFQQQVKRTPEAVAVTAVDGELTYAELATRSDQLAAYLRQFDIQPDTLIGLALPRDTSMLVAILGILKAGGAYLPLDPSYPDQRIQYMLDHAQAPLLITNAELVETLPENEAEAILIDADWAKIEQVPALAQDFSRLEDLAYVIYTSGSTGKPKGVQITQGNLANFLNTMQEKPGISAEDTLLAVTTLSFDIATLELYLPLISGARVLLADQATIKDALQLLKLLDSESVTMMQATPATWQILLAAGWEGKAGLKILSGGEALPVSLAQELLARGTAVWNMYGPTETTVWSTCLQVTAEECQTEGVVSIGKPIGNTDVYVLDDHLQPVPIGVTGNLYIGGKGVARGYLHRPDLTAERFPQHPFKPEERIYFTGDLARYRPDGSIEFLGRSDHQVKVRGFRIELGEIENCLQQHPDIAQAVVHPQGEQLVAYLIAQGEAQPDVTALRNHVQESLPSYMVPHRFLFLPEYPLTPNGKVDRKALPLPDDIVLASTREYAAPRSDREQQLADIWQTLLNLRQVGINDNFFELGGDSISAIRFIAQAKEVGLHFRPSQLFQKQTIAELALLATEQTAVSATPGQALEEFTDFSILTGTPAAQEFLSHTEQIQYLYGLTPTQRAILFHTLYAPETGVYVEQNAFEMEDLDVDLYAQAWQQLIQRHELLRTAFFWENIQEPVQMVVQDVPFPLTILDWRGQTDVQQKAQLQELMASERQTGFDLARPPLLRLYVIQVDETRHFVLMNYHHILFDGWSNVVLNLEIRAYYDALRQEETLNLPTPTPYRSYLSWLHEQEESEAKAYWQEYLANFEEATPIPIAEQMNQGIYGAVEEHAEQSVRLPTELWTSLQALLAEHKITYNNFMQAVWGIVLNRYSGEDDVLFGTVVHGRPAELPQFDRMVGLFINVLPVRLQFQKDESVLAWLKRSHETFIDQSQFSHNSLEQIQQWGGFPRERNLFHSLFINNNPASDNMPPPPTDSRPLFVQEKTNYALNFYLKPKEVVQITYDPTLFTAVSIKRMLTHIVQIVRHIVAQPEQRMADLTILPANERSLLLETWNNWPTPVSKGSLVSDFRALATQQPNVAAVIDPAHGTLTYAELDEKSDQLAAYLQKMGIRHGRIGLHLERTYHFPICFWGILKSGNTYVPLDAKHPEQRLAFMIENATLDAVISHSALRAALPQIGQPVVLIDEIEPQLAELPTLEPVEMAETAVILYTSGSSGQPKGVRLPHQALHTYVHTAVNQFQLTSSDNVLQFASIGFDTSLEETGSAHLSGATLILRTEESLSSIQAFLNFCHTYQITVLDLPTAFWHTLTIELQRDPSLQLPAGIRLIIIGGEKASPEHLASWRSLATDQTTLLNTYGPTETTIVATSCVVAGPNAVSRAELAPIGKPLPSARVYVVDQYDQLAPVGIPGELLVAGPQVAAGYVELPEETAAKFISDPFADEGKVYRTGDRVRFLDDGILQFVGRTDRQIKIRGHRIEPETLEQLLNQHEDIADTAVTTQPDSQNNLQVVAYLIPQNGFVPDQQTLVSYLRQQLPAYMVPAAFVTLDSFPKTSNGKINYRALPAPTFKTQSDAQYEAPRTPIEETIADLFSQLTNVEKVGLYDNFFQLGGHSLLITQLASRIQSIFEVELSLRTLFEHPTVVDMALIVEDKMLEMVEALDDEEIDLLL